MTKADEARLYGEITAMRYLIEQVYAMACWATPAPMATMAALRDGLLERMERGYLPDGTRGSPEAYAVAQAAVVATEGMFNRIEAVLREEAGRAPKAGPEEA